LPVGSVPLSCRQCDRRRVLVQQRRQRQRPRAQVRAGRPAGDADLPGMRAANLAAAGALTDVRDQPRNVRPNRRQVFDELLAGRDAGQRVAAARAVLQGNDDFFIDVVGAATPVWLVPRGPTDGTVRLGRLAFLLRSAKGRGLAMRGAFEFFAACLELPDPLEQFVDRRAQPGILCGLEATPREQCGPKNGQGCPYHSGPRPTRDARTTRLGWRGHSGRVAGRMPAPPLKDARPTPAGSPP